MKINDINRTGSIQSYRNQNRDNGIVSRHKGNARDEVYISAEAKQLLGAQEIDPMRAGKVANLKHAVATGSYYVEANKVAEKLLPYFNE